MKLDEVLSDLTTNQVNTDLFAGLFGDTELDVVSGKISAIQSTIKSIQGLIDSGALADPGVVERAKQRISDLSEEFVRLRQQQTGLEIDKILSTLNKALSSIQSASETGIADILLWGK